MQNVFPAKLANFQCFQAKKSKSSSVFSFVKDYGERYQYDLFFSGVIRKEQTNNWRYDIYNKLSKLNKYKIFINAKIFEGNGKIPQ